MRFLFAFCFLFVVDSVRSQPVIDNLLNELQKTIEHKEEYVEAKLTRIGKYKAKTLQSTDRFDIFYKIYEEYKTLNYDSAFTYARKLQVEAYRSNDPSKIAFAKVKLGFILLSSGMFNEALDSLLSIDRNSLRDSSKKEFFHVVARTYFDLVDFNRDQYFTERYTRLGLLYVDSALVLCSNKSAEYFSLRAMKNLRLEKIDDARSDFEYLISNFTLTDSELAIAASTLAYIYQRQGNIDKAIEFLIQASMADNRSSTKETLAILNLAELLYKKGDVVRAYEYVKLAMDDANFYGARHRKIQVAAIFPIIEGNKLDTVERQRKLLFVYAFLITVLSVITIAFAFIIYKQFKKLKIADKKIKEANTNLQETNRLLQEVNTHLMEANKIKEEYIGYYFNINTEYIEKIEAFKRSIENKLLLKKFDDIRFVVGNINIKKEREELYFSFDKVFLKLFPDFVITFNSYFKDEDKIVLKDGQLLNTELRIFALIRMGIHDTEKIAKILDYSINTIYNYKARIKSKSLLPNEEFERKIMSIQTI